MDNGPAVILRPPDPGDVLTWRQRKVLQVIRDSIKERGYPPSLQEIGKAVGLTSTSSVSHHLRTLQRAGYLHRDSGRPRTVEVSLHTAVLQVRAGAAFGLRRNAFWVHAEDRPDGKRWDLVAARFADIGELAEYVASFGPDAVVLNPPDLREAVIAKLRAVKLESLPPAKPETASRDARDAAHINMPDDGEVDEVAREIGAAMAAGRRVRLRHYNPKTDAVTERDVDPIGLIVDRGRPYLYGWCVLREDRRFFRLDRVLALEVLDVPASPPADAEDFNIARGLFRPSHDDEAVELELSAAGRWVAEYFPYESVTEVENGRLRVVLRTPDTSWVRRLALRLGQDGRVLSPAVLVTEIREAAEAALENYLRGSATAELDPRDFGPRPAPDARDDAICRGQGQAPRTARAVLGSSASIVAAMTRPSATAGA
jgi:predicted DNA-binding transcriptional regulator YafY